MGPRPPAVEHETAWWAPHTAQLAYGLVRAIDWTHEHHRRTTDILAAKGVPWEKKEERTARAVQVYLRRTPLARSPAPIEVTLRRAGVTAKPYFTVFRTEYPRTTGLVDAGHWWDAAVCDALLLAGNDQDQETALADVGRALGQVLDDRPDRMVLSREVMPRCARLLPASANAFDNLHLLQALAYDILAYEEWSPAEKRAELYSTG